MQRDAPGADRAGRAFQRVGEIRARSVIQRGRDPLAERTGLHQEQREDLGFQLWVAERLAREVNEVDGALGAARALLRGGLAESGAHRSSGLIRVQRRRRVFPQP